MKEKEYKVRAIHCKYDANEQEIYDSLYQVTKPLNKSWEKIEKAKKILIKFNSVWPPEKIRYFKGRYQELVDPSVMLAVLSLLKERTDAEIYVVDTSLTGTESDVYFKPLLKKHGVSFINASEPELQWYKVPGGGLIFNKYLLTSHIADADAIISVAKLKSHAYTGFTLCSKNMFGWSPLPPHGRVRQYFHHFIRLPYAMADLGLITNPCLNIVDGLTGQSGKEWGGKGRITNTLIAGDNVMATDTCGLYLMGHDYKVDYPSPPFKRERNYVLLAANKGMGPADLDEIDFESEIEPPLAEFDSNRKFSKKLIYKWRKTAAEQGLYYRDNRQKYIEKYAGEHIYLQDGEVVWHGKNPGKIRKSRRSLSGNKKDSALWLKHVNPEDQEQENYDVYEKELQKLKDIKL